MSKTLNEQHEAAVRATRVQVAQAVQGRAVEMARQSTGWRRVLYWLLAAGVTVAAWWYGPGLTEQTQPGTTPGAPAEVQKHEQIEQ